MSNTKEIINQFQPITLQEMKGVKLLNRIDNKFVTTVEKLTSFLQLAKDAYYVQEAPVASDSGVGQSSSGEKQSIGTRMMPYHTIYLDTPNMDMYYAHANGRSHRFKVRMRRYEASGDTFLEVKNKSNKGRTKKKRRAISPEVMSISQSWDKGPLAYDKEEEDFVDGMVPYDAESLKPVIENHFERITLVNKQKTERLTIDTNLWFHNLTNNRVKRLPQCIVIELKRDGRTESPSLSLFRELHIKPQGFSKMALGLAMTDPSLKQNLFKERIHQIERLTVKG